MDNCDDDGPKKHPCKDCHSCQFCSDSRCGVCRAGKKCRKRLSTEEQIAMYEKLNQDIDEEFHNIK